MSHTTDIRRMPAFGLALLVCALLALAGPGPALAADTPTGGESSQVFSAEEEGVARSDGSSMEDGAGSGGSSPEDADERSSDDGERPAEEPDPRPARSSGRSPSGEGSRGEDDGSDGRGGRPAPSRVVTARKPAPPSLHDDLRRRLDSVRRETRSEAAATRRRLGRLGDEIRASVRGNGRDEGSSRRSGDDGEIRFTVQEEGEQIQLYSGNRNIHVGRRALIRGYIPARASGRNVVLEVRTGGEWVAVDRAVTVEDGRFYLEWYPSRPGHFRVRVRPWSTTTTTQPSDPRLLYIYRTAVASWYGPGFYGNTTACGQTFTSQLMGVAHRSLPCGYRVTIRYNGRGTTVPVVDRGPYISGRDYDLTEALRNYLGFDGVDEVWATA